MKKKKKKILMREKQNRVLLRTVFLVNPLARSQSRHILCSGSRWVIMVIDKLKRFSGA